MSVSFFHVIHYRTFNFECWNVKSDHKKTLCQSANLSITIFNFDGSKSWKFKDRSPSERDELHYFWSQDPYNWYVVLVGTHSKILLENSRNWKLSKPKVLNWKLPKLKVAKIESCQNWSCQNCQNCQNWKLLGCQN